ncbi:class I SAM-dependent methyltransferase [Olivibacter sp. SDN3]|uniref:O-methyltransferase n=1 Tax=Olivibacter sp. SDN3 TaxID=2764720 RepID=UPI0016515054|nr:class I SAM-dependent methyltransferase [Olivibacter sp. SDN3]QNL48368.1 class I SAM-dependent methyltransferase [Olivibacter sp. SDN3]
MNEEINQPLPVAYNDIREATKQSGFSMASDILTCSLLRTLAGTKPSGRFLELGTGTGLSTAWILDGMDSCSYLISIDNDAQFIKVAHRFLGKNEQLNLINTDSGEWITNNKGQKFDYIFADTWHGKYTLLEEVLALLNKGGLYIIDDMLPQPNWPSGHSEKATTLIKYLESRDDLLLTKQTWATGIVVAVKK